jgi:hypothetical protein
MHKETYYTAIMKVSVATGLENESLIYCFPNCKFSQDPPPEGKDRYGERTVTSSLKGQCNAVEIFLKVYTF